jgi:hypothetical protein
MKAHVQPAAARLAKPWGKPELCRIGADTARLPTGCLNVKWIGMDPPHPLIRQTGIVELRKAIARPVRAM